MKGKTMGKLAVKQLFKGGEEKELWRKVGHQSDTWMVDNIGFGGNNQSFSIVFEAEMLHQFNNWGDIAIDDILVDKTECVSIPTSTPPTTSSGNVVTSPRYFSVFFLFCLTIAIVYN